MNKFKLIAKYPEYAEYTELDTLQDFNISLNYQIEDILDISSRNTSYSKTITLPGTTINNLFFKSVFDVNVNNLTFNPVKRVPAFVTVTDNQVFKGDLQLLNIKINNEAVEYEVTLLGKLRDILTDMSDYNLKELDMSEYDHTRDKDTIVDSWDYNIYINGNLTDVGGPGIGYVYPHIVREVDTQPNSSFFTYDYNYYPAFYLKTIIDKIFEFTNYTYTSNFFNSEYFKKLIIPFTSDKFTIDEADYNDSILYVGLDPTAGEAPFYPVNTGYISLTGVFYRNSQWYENSDFNFDFNLNKFSGTLGLGSSITEAPFQFQNPNNQWGQFGGWVNNEVGYYDIDLKIRCFPKWFAATTFDIKYNGTGQFYYRYGLGKIPAGVGLNGGFVTLTSSGTLPFSPSDDLVHPNPWYDTATPLLLDAFASNIYLNAGDRIIVWFEAVYPITDLDGNDTGWDVGGDTSEIASNSVRMSIVASPFYDSTGDNPSRLKISKTTSQSYGQETGFMNQIVPDIKMKDFFLDIVKMFNLVIVDDAIEENNLIIEPRDDYYASKQKVLDWEKEKKLDYDSEVKITPMSELNARNYLFKYTDDDDWLNKEYTEETNKSYGELEIDVENDFSINTNKTEILFSPTPCGNHQYNSIYGNFVAPYFVEYDGATYKSKVVKPRILFYNGLTDLPSSQNLFRIIDTLNNSSEAFNQFPYCGMWDNPTNPKWDLGFGRTDKIYWETNQFPSQNLYEKFHKATLNNIIDINSKLLEGYFHLTPKDIAQLDFRDIVFLEGQYWRINKVKDYNPVGSDQLTKVELYRISDVRTYEQEQIEITTSNDQCPLDIVAQKVKGVWYYISLSGQEVSAGCCRQMNGVIVNGQCRVPNVPVGPVTPVKPDLVSGPGIIDTYKPIKFKSGGPFIVPVNQKNGPISNRNNFNSVNSPGIIQGRENLIPISAGSNIIVGNNNTIGPDIKNIIVVGDNIYADNSGSIYLENGYFNPFGEFVKTQYYIIEGGEDEVFEVMKENLIDVVDGTEDAIRNFGGDSKARPVIDGNINISINPDALPPEL